MSHADEAEDSLGGVGEDPIDCDEDDSISGVGHSPADLALRTAS